MKIQLWTEGMLYYIATFELRVDPRGTSATLERPMVLQWRGRVFLANPTAITANVYCEVTHDELTGNGEFDPGMKDYVMPGPGEGSRK